MAPTAEDSPELFRTVHGSHLYGLAHAGSDHDLFIVTSSQLPRPRQVIRGDVDYMFIGMDAFLRRAMSGSHQSCEAAFSPCKEFTAAGQAWAPLIAGLRVTDGEAMHTYERTIKKFSFGDFKRRRHAVRLTYNLAELREHGRFNPVMTPDEVAEANRLAGTLAGEALALTLLPGIELRSDELNALREEGAARLGG